jgi:hypothetical protein
MLVMQLFEPQGRDSYVSWGFWNAYFEQKEYMEPYMLEKIAEEMLAKDPALKAEFEGKLAKDPEFQKNADARLDFFYRRHGSFDPQMNVLPYYRAAPSL